MWKQVFHSFATENKLQLHKSVCENKDFCNIIMPSEDTEILEFNQYKESDKAPFIIFEDLACILENIDGCKNNPENSLGFIFHILSGFSISTRSSFRSIENKHDVFRGKDCMKKFCKFFREHALKITNFEKKIEFIYKRVREIIWKCKRLLYLQKKKKKKKNENKYLEDIKYKKVRDHCHYTFKIQCA